MHLEVSGGVPNEIGHFIAGNEVTAGVMITEGLNCLIGPSTAQMYRYNVAGTDAISVGVLTAWAFCKTLWGLQRPVPDLMYRT
ncbi:MAG: hypothetical protein GY930_04390 [bacterium]|nr:hypothetical protein [bacterium]